MTHVFLSYCHDNQAEVASLRGELQAAGENVWWDQDIKGGQNWELEIRREMNQSYAVLLCLSKESEARSKSGIYPEARDAIEAYREFSPGEVFLIPVRLSECKIPDLKIDATTWLDRLQYVDLFPEEKRAEGLQRLLDAIRATPHHP